MKTTEILDTNVDQLFDKISALIEEARQRVSTTVNIAEVYTKYNVGRYIVEDEQKGNYRAEYGKQVIKLLSKKLEDKFGDGWSVDTLTRCRKFYGIYSTTSISATLLPKFKPDQQNLTNSSSPGLITLSSCVSRMPMPAASMKSSAQSRTGASDGYNVR